MLKEFRSIDIYWDKATRRIYEEIRSSSSDEKGRKLTVQIVNDGQIQDLTNVALNLYWETQDGENRGLDPFEPLDPENGIYELYFRTGMLQHVGKLNAHLHLVDTTGAITSEPFTIVVFPGINVDAMASGNELSALNKALIEVQNIKQDEAERVSAETERATAEEERVSNENERKNAETIRLTNETDRVDNEEDRVSAESDRVSAESSRIANENARLSAESDRVSAENVRAEGYPLLDGRLAAVEQNIEVVELVQAKISDGTSPALEFVFDVPEGFTSTGAVVHHTSSFVLINYFQGMLSEKFRVFLYQFNGANIAPDKTITVTVTFRKETS